MDRAAQSRALRLKGEFLGKVQPRLSRLSSRRPSLVHQLQTTSRDHPLCMIRSRVSRSHPAAGRKVHGGCGLSAPSNFQAAVACGRTFIEPRCITV